ncbi:6375_t:CDS:2 [Ambispora gerdemannii]|uniref:6375_t:CDS:1 n=1 Tax=Ambispora gerdemannii TaxID=144530 RepID=A0A9N8YLB7_9GLOM|nr:6375_t:CDS:2 [Ambispora gerdemannii]
MIIIQRPLTWGRRSDEILWTRFENLADLRLFDSILRTHGGLQNIESMTHHMQFRKVFRYKTMRLESGNINVKTNNNLRIHVERVNKNIVRLYFAANRGAQAPIPVNAVLRDVTSNQNEVPYRNEYFFTWIPNYILLQNGVEVLRLDNQKQQAISYFFTKSIITVATLHDCKNSKFDSWAVDFIYEYLSHRNFLLEYLKELGILASGIHIPKLDPCSGYLYQSCRPPVTQTINPLTQDSMIVVGDDDTASNENNITIMRNQPSNQAIDKLPGLLQELSTPTKSESTEVDEDDGSENFISKDLVKLYQKATKAEKRVTFAYQEEIRCWYHFTEKFEKSVKDAMDNNSRLNDQQARSRVYDEVAKHLPDFTRESLRKKTAKAKYLGCVVIPLL